MATDIEMYRGDTCPIAAALVDENGDPLDLTTASVIHLSVRKDLTTDDLVLDTCDALWTAKHANVVQALDTADRKVGRASLQLTVADGAPAAAVLAYQTLADDLDLSEYTSLHMWIKSSTNTNSGDLQMVFDTNAGCTYPILAVDVPALTANTWTHVVIVLGDTHLMTAITDFGIKMAVDLGACVIRLDDIVLAYYVIEKADCVAVGDPTAGNVEVLLAASLTEYKDAGNWYHDIETTFADGSKYSQPAGRFKILGDVNRPD